MLATGLGEGPRAIPHTCLAVMTVQVTPPKGECSERSQRMGVSLAMLTVTFEYIASSYVCQQAPSDTTNGQYWRFLRSFKGLFSTYSTARVMSAVLSR